MKNLSIITQIIVINILIMTIFVGIFIYKNYVIVSEQLILLEDKKIDSIVKTIAPIISKSFPLGLENNINQFLRDGIKNHSEIISVKILDNDKRVIYEIKDDSSKDLKLYTLPLYDYTKNSKIGEFQVYYTFSSIYETLLKEFYSFLFIVFILFIILILISSFLIRKNLKPLQVLKEKMLSYSINNKSSFKKENFKNEISVINNSVYKMVKKIEKEVEKRVIYEKEIMQKNRLASMGEMLDNIAHQWRQPLMKINATLLNIDRSIELKKYDDEYLQKKLDEISNTVYFMSKTIDTFRDFLNPYKVKQSFEVSSCIEKILNFLENSLKDIKIIFDRKKVYINDSESELMQVLISILSNSIDIFSQRGVKEKEIFIRVFEDETYVFIEIEDTAGGIKTENLEKVFDPYFTTKQKYGGTGMGLYIVKSIVVKSLKGDIKVQNGSFGAKFILNLPK